MKKLCLIVGLAGALWATTAQAAFDGTITMNEAAYHSGNGGEFKATITGIGTFSTFCIEDTEYFGYSNTYDYNINTGAIQGGGGPKVDDVRTGLKKDNISIGTAYLYSQFRNNNLTDGAWNYFDPTTRADNAGELQNAIWFLEDEGGSMSTHMSDILTAKFGAHDANYANWKEDSNGEFGVVVLNLYNGNFPHGPWNTQVTFPTDPTTTVWLDQDQLAIVPEPTTMIAGAMLLLPFGASAIRILRRKA